MQANKYNFASLSDISERREGSYTCSDCGFRARIGESICFDFFSIVICYCGCCYVSVRDRSNNNHSRALLLKMLSLGAMTTDEISIGFLNLLIEFMVVIVHSSRKTVSYSSITVDKPLSMRGIETSTTLFEWLRK